MRYTGPKMKLCRREGKNLFGSPKYDIKKGYTLPGKGVKGLARLSEYGKLLRNKQVVKRTYQMSETQFSTLVNVTALKNAKSQSLNHDASLYQLLERRCDALLVRSGVAKTIMQSRQMMTHGHWLLNGIKHNIPSYYMKPGDVLTLRKSLQNSPLYSRDDVSVVVPFWVQTSKADYSVSLVQYPTADNREMPADLLKVIEFYARV